MEQHVQRNVEAEHIIDLHTLHMMDQDVHQKMIGMEDHVIPKDVVVALIHHMVAGEAGEAAQHHVVEEFNIDIELIQIILIIMVKIVELCTATVVNEHDAHIASHMPVTQHI